MNGPRLLLSTGTVYVYPLRTAFALAQAAGCDGVELVVGPELGLRGPRAIRRLAAEMGVSMRAIHPPLFGFPGWRRPCDVLRRIVALALSLQIPTIVVHPPRATRPDSPVITRFQDCLGEAQQRLRGNGSTIVLENPGFYGPRDYHYVLSDLPTLCRFADEARTGLALDTTHAGDSPYPLLQSYAIIGTRLRHIHLSDTRTPPRWLEQRLLDTYVKHHQLPGEGLLPLAEFVSALARDGYAGDITLEISPISLQMWSFGRANDRLRQAVNSVQAWWSRGT